ncbi:hypothetical protein BCR34DRAFT_454878, partial [Clohesyomyces aquaticus]
GAASGIAVASRALQLLHSVNAIKSFIRSAKGASSEVERLLELFERLSALLDEVRNVLELQSSLSAQHFPPPSPIIVGSLKSCESQLQPLKDIFEKYQ